MDQMEFHKLVQKLVMGYNNQVCEPGNEVKEADVYIVWSSKTLQNNKAMASTPISDGRYYEITHNGSKKEVYFDAYVKEHNEAIDVSVHGFIQR